MDIVAENKMQKLQAILEDWAEWMKSYRPRIGYPERAMVCAGAGNQHFEDMCDASDKAICEAVDATIGDLTPAQQAAIHRRYLNAVWRFPRANYNYADALLEAHEQLMKKLPRKGVDFYNG